MSAGGAAATPLAEPARATDAGLLDGVELHAPNESVDPREIELCALAEALFLRDYAEAHS